MQSGPRIPSLRQRWAWAVAAGRNQMENRTWSTPYRGTVYIHASRTREPRREAEDSVPWRKHSRDRGYINTHRVPLARLVVPPPPNHQRDALVLDRLDDRRESVE